MFLNFQQYQTLCFLKQFHNFSEGQATTNNCRSVANRRSLKASLRGRNITFSGQCSKIGPRESLQRVYNWIYVSLEIRGAPFPCPCVCPLLRSDESVSHLQSWLVSDFKKINGLRDAGLLRRKRSNHFCFATDRRENWSDNAATCHKERQLWHLLACESIKRYSNRIDKRNKRFWRTLAYRKNSKIYI